MHRFLLATPPVTSKTLGTLGDSEVSSVLWPQAVAVELGLDRGGGGPASPEASWRRRAGGRGGGGDGGAGEDEEGLSGPSGVGTGRGPAPRAGPCRLRPASSPVRSGFRPACRPAPTLLGPPIPRPRPPPDRLPAAG